MFFSGKLLDIAYMVDSNGDIVLAKFWGGLKVRTVSVATFQDVKFIKDDQSYH